MKPTLAEYICREKADIFRQQQSVERMSKLLTDLQDCYDQVHWQEASLNDATTDKSKARPLREASKEAASGEVNGASLARRISQASTDKSEIAPLRGATGRVAEESFQLPFTTGPVSVKCKAKSDDYRLELLKQIEEKQNRKQLEIEREKAADEELERKIAQQRLSMYLDYLEERKRGDFISKRKPIEQEAKASADRSTAKGVAFVSAGDQESEKAAPQQEPATNVDEPRRKQAIGNKDGNILANLNEVRQIMQHDHIEMLEKLLELHIQ